MVANLKILHSYSWNLEIFETPWFIWRWWLLPNWSLDLFHRVSHLWNARRFWAKHLEESQLYLQVLPDVLKIINDVVDISKLFLDRSWLHHLERIQLLFQAYSGCIMIPILSIYRLCFSPLQPLLAPCPKTQVRHFWPYLPCSTSQLVIRFVTYSPHPSRLHHTLAESR